MDTMACSHHIASGDLITIAQQKHADRGKMVVRVLRRECAFAFMRTGDRRRSEAGSWPRAKRPELRDNVVSEHRGAEL